MDRKYIADLIGKIDDSETEFFKCVDDSLFRIASNAGLFWDDETQTDYLNEYGVLSDSQRQQVWDFIRDFQANGGLGTAEALDSDYSPDEYDSWLTAFVD